MRAYKDKKRFFRHWTSLPFIYFQIVPLVFLDISIEFYHRICFPLYGLPCIKRWEYIKIDRHKLSYLNWLEKMNCVYCGYGNGFARYLSAIAGETEKYWCGIKHAKDPNFLPPEHHQDYLEYGDEKGFDDFMKK